MIYTSGSTGLPKGVMVTHANLLAFTMWALKVTEAKPGDALAHFSSFSFDASLDDLVAMFGSGATLHILDEGTRRDMTAFHDYLVKNKIAVMDLPAAYAMTLLNTFDDVPLRCLSTGGEKLLPTRYLPKRFINGYGPTEFTVCSSIHDVNPAEDGDDIPIGRPVPNTLSAIVDADGNLLPRGMVGELVLAGAQLTKGYWRRPELTAEKFVSFPWLKTFNLQPSTFNLAYRTGDLARWNEAGELLYCGRIDSQIKLRGFRIELGEIESAMTKFPGVASAVADVKKANGLERLVGYYVATGDIDGTALRTELAKTLTDYMVPDVFVRLERIPMTPAGKVDRKALPMPEITAGEIIAPETEVEKKLFDVVAAELKTTDFGVTTNLITLGLSSLRAIRLSAVIRRDTGLVVSTGDILAKPRIRDWARTTGEDETIPVLPPRETYPLTANQLGIYVEWERDRSGLQYNVVTVLRFGNVDSEKLRDAVAKAVAAHPSLKVRFEECDGEIVQVRRDGAELPIRLERLDAAPDAAFFTGMIRPFDLLKDDLARFAVYGHGGDAWLFCDIHHTIFDGSSSDVLLTAICEALAGQSPKVEHVTAFDYALFLAEWQRSKGRDDSRRHYRELLSGTESFKYPSRRGDAAPSGRAAHRVFRVARPEIRPASNFSAQHSLRSIG